MQSLFTKKCKKILTMHAYVYIIIYLSWYLLSSYVRSCKIFKKNEQTLPFSYAFDRALFQQKPPLSVLAFISFVRLFLEFLLPQLAIDVFSYITPRHIALSSAVTTILSFSVNIVSTFVVSRTASTSPPFLRFFN